MKRLVFLILFLLFPLNLEAKGNEFIIECDKVEFQEFEDFVCRSKINSAFNYDKITFDIVTTDGVILKEARTNYNLLWKVSSKKGQVTAQTLKKQLVNGYQEFGILLFSISEYGKQNITIKNIVLTNSEKKETLKIDDAKIEIKMQSSENRLKEIKINGNKITDFFSNNYNYYIKSNDEVINIEAIPLDKNAKIDGIGEIKLDPKVRETIIPINVVSENGVHKIYKLFIINNNIKETNITASLIELFDEKDNNINFNFKNDVYEYNLELAPNIKTINTKVTLDNKDYELIKGYGNQVVNIEKGANIIFIKVKDSTGDIKTYIINITKLLFNKSSNSYLKNIIIDGYNIKFNKRIKQYNLAIKKSDHKLDINAIPEDNSAVVNIIGNEDLKDGSIIKIIVKADNESKITYQLHITNKNNSFISYIIYIIIGILLFGLIFRIFVRVKKFIINYISNKKKKIANDKNKYQVKEKAAVQKTVINKSNKKVVGKNIKKNDSKKEKPQVTKKKISEKSGSKLEISSSKTNVTKEKPINKKTKKKPSEKNNSKPQISSGRISATKKKPINKKTKKKQLKTKKQNKKRSTKK